MSEIKIVRGNTFAIRTHVRAFRLDGTEIDDFDLSACTDVKVMARTAYSRKELEYAIQEDNNMRVVFPAAIQHVGCYGLEVTGKLRGVEWRFYNRHILTIVESNAEAEIPEESIIDDDYYEVEGAVLVMSDPYDDTALRDAINRLTDAVNALSERIEQLEGGDFH